MLHVHADVLCADTDNCKKKKKRRNKLTKYKSWRTDLVADTLHVDVDVDGGGGE